MKRDANITMSTPLFVVLDHAFSINYTCQRKPLTTVNKACYDGGMVRYYPDGSRNKQRIKGNNECREHSYEDHYLRWS